MKKLNVKIPNKKYDIFWVDGFLELKNKIQEIINLAPKKQSRRNKYKICEHNVVITNTTIGKLYRKEIETLFYDIPIIYIGDGEKFKRLETIEKITSQMLDLGLTRSTRVWAFGGGVIGDISGFVASIYMRGVNYIQIPTTLLSMVDSSVGGKTGVNLSHGKNSIGSFYQPDAVFINVEFLTTLPQKEINCGLAEIIKASLILKRKKDLAFFHFLESNITKILEKDLKLFEKLSYESVQIKSWVVIKDEKEQNLRAILNLGHTLAHAIESYFHYEKINHGEAVSIGLSFAVFYSLHKEYICEETWLRVYHLLGELKLYKNLSDIFPKNKLNIKLIDELITLMKNDKKNLNDNIRFIFIDGIGKFRLAENVEYNELKETMLSFLELN